MWTKGTVEVSGGRFRDNGAKKVGGVVILGDEGTIVLDGGDFEGNEASDGGVVFVGSDAKLSVSGGEFMDNKASNFGGAFFVDNDGMVEVRKPYAEVVVVSTCGVFCVHTVLCYIL